MKFTLEGDANWEQYIEVAHRVKIISGGAGAYGANNSTGCLIPASTKAGSGGNSKIYPKVMLNNFRNSTSIWGLCAGWRIELEMLKSYTIYGGEALNESDRKNELLANERQ